MPAVVELFRVAEPCGTGLPSTPFWFYAQGRPHLFQHADSIGFVFSVARKVRSMAKRFLAGTHQCRALCRKSATVELLRLSGQERRSCHVVKSQPCLRSLFPEWRGHSVIIDNIINISNINMNNINMNTINMNINNINAINVILVWIPLPSHARQSSTSLPFWQIRKVSETGLLML